MELVTVFRIAFVVGLVAIPILYILFFGRGTGKPTQDRARNRDEKRGEHRSEEHGPGGSD